MCFPEREHRGPDVGDVWDGLERVMDAVRL
jgi:hypothetical protein